MHTHAMKLVLLPGMDGTGTLFSEFTSFLGADYQITTVSYPSDQCLSYRELTKLVLPSFPLSDSFVLIAESFSTPLAIHCASLNPPNLKCMVLCAGFATSPLRGWKKSLTAFISPLLFRATLSSFIIRSYLVGSNAPAHLVKAVQAAVSSVQPDVLRSRLQSILSCDARAELSHVNVSILYLHATEDKLVPARCVDEILTVRPDAAVVSIHGPHLLIQREPAKTADAVVRFISQLRQDNRNREYEN